jgi:hypothetical protein
MLTITPQAQQNLKKIFDKSLSAGERRLSENTHKTIRDGHIIELFICHKHHKKEKFKMIYYKPGEMPPNAPLFDTETQKEYEAFRAEQSNGQD